MGIRGVGAGGWLAVRGLVALRVQDSRVRGNDGVGTGMTVGAGGGGGLRLAGGRAKGATWAGGRPSTAMVVVSGSFA